MRKITALFMASTLALGAVNLASAAETTSSNDGVNIDAQHHMDGQRHHKGGRDGGRDGWHGSMFRDLNLTDAQKEQIRTIMKDRHDQMRESWHADRRGMHDVVASDSFDKAKAQAQVDKMTENYKARMLSHLEEQNKVYNILTPEQKKQFNDNFEKRLTERSKR